MSNKTFKFRIHFKEGNHLLKSERISYRVNYQERECDRKYHNNESCISKELEKNDNNEEYSKETHYKVPRTTKKRQSLEFC